MTARSAAIILVAAAILAACGPRVIAAPHALSQPVQLEIIRLPRIWLAGFVANNERGLDVSGETVRLLRQRLSTSSPAGVVDAAPVHLADESAFNDRVYWRRLGEELGYPLILTGAVRLLVAPAVEVQRGRRTTYLHATGRVLKATVVLIDGWTGAVVATKELPQRMQYATGRVSPVALYYDLMDRALTDWLASIAMSARSGTGEEGDGS